MWASLRPSNFLMDDLSCGFLQGFWIALEFLLGRCDVPLGRWGSALSLGKAKYLEQLHLLLRCCFVLGTRTHGLNEAWLGRSGGFQADLLLLKWLWGLWGYLLLQLVCWIRNTSCCFTFFTLVVISCSRTGNSTCQASTADWRNQLVTP